MNTPTIITFDSNKDFEKFVDEQLHPKNIYFENITSNLDKKELKKMGISNVYVDEDGRRKKLPIHRPFKFSDTYIQFWGKDDTKENLSNIFGDCWVVKSKLKSK